MKKESVIKLVKAVSNEYEINNIMEQLNSYSDDYVFNHSEISNMLENNIKPKIKIKIKKHLIKVGDISRPIETLKDDIYFYQMV